MRILTRAIITIIMAVTAVEISAQEPSVYVVKKGELLVNIAERYGTTVERLEELNPELTKGLFYDGMKLIIPQDAMYQPRHQRVPEAVEPVEPAVVAKPYAKEAPTAKEAPFVHEEPFVQEAPFVQDSLKDSADYRRMKVRLIRDKYTHNVFGIAYGQKLRDMDSHNPAEEPQEKTRKPKRPHYINHFSHVYLYYESKIDQLDKGFYGVSELWLTKWGLGLEGTLASSLGIVKNEFAGYGVKAGPAYGFAPTRRVAIVASLGYWWMICGVGKSYRGERQWDNTWGFSATPRIIVDLGIVKPTIGVDINWSHLTKKVKVLPTIAIGLF